MNRENCVNLILALQSRQSAQCVIDTLIQRGICYRIRGGCSSSPGGFDRSDLTDDIPDCAKGRARRECLVLTPLEEPSELGVVVADPL